MIIEVSKDQLLTLERLYPVSILTGRTVCGGGIVVPVPRTVIRDQLPHAGRIVLNVFDLYGQLQIFLRDDDERGDVEHNLSADFPLGKLPEMARAEAEANARAEAERLKS